jgi:hypothetical protein
LLIEGAAPGWINPRTLLGLLHECAKRNDKKVLERILEKDEKLKIDEGHGTKAGKNSRFSFLLCSQTKKKKKKERHCIGLLDWDTGNSLTCMHSHSFISASSPDPSFLAV